MGATRLGKVTFAIGFAGLGMVSLISGNFEVFWRLFPALAPWAGTVACVSGAMLLAGGIGMLIPRTERIATMVITINAMIWLVLFGLPRVVTHVGNELVWLSFGENLMLVTGGWTLLAAANPATGAPNLRVALVLYGIALPPVGLSHFVYARLTASMVPAWLPFHTGFAYLTGAGHIAAGLGILFGVLPRLAATAEATMISIFTLLVQVPSIFASPSSREPWLETLLSAALAGAAWVIAGSLEGAGRTDSKSA